MEGGGYATTRGGRFQALWAAHQLLLVLAEELTSVRIEPAGREGDGVDLVVALDDGRTEYQQCKRSNRQEGKWTVGELCTRGVVAAIAAQLGAEPEARFQLVSTDPAPDLRDLAESARCSLDPESFYRDQVRASKDRSRAFAQLCDCLQLDPTSAADLIYVHDLLARCEVTVAGDDEGELRELRTLARRWVDGEPGAVVAALAAWSLEKLRSTITAADVDAFLRGGDFHPRRLERDPRIVPAVQSLQERFDLSTSGELIRGQMLPRDETSQLVDLLRDPEGPRLIALHGPAGVGKSGVLLETTRHLQAEAVPYLPVRLDRQRPRGTTRQLGESLGLRESPALCLGALSRDGLGVLVLDQLDALRWTGEDAQAMDVFQELVREAMGFPNVRVVASCRSFELEHDPQIRVWVEREKARKLRVERLSEETVKRVVTDMGGSAGALGPRQLELLRTIYLLRVWEETSRVADGVVDFATERELLDAFWRSRLLQAQTLFDIPAATLQAAVNRVVDHMDRHAALVAPRRLLANEPAVEDALQSLNVITVADNDLAFCHQSYLDHQLARRLLERLDDGELSVEDWLTSRDQGLFRREQLRLVLEMLREEQYERYISAVRGLLDAREVRFHLKQLVLEVLGRVEDPQAGETDLVLSLLSEDAWREHVALDVLVGHRRWVLVAKAAGILERWLESDYGSERDYALRVLASVVEDAGEECHQLLAPRADRDDEWTRRVANVLRGRPVKDSPSIFELRVRLAKLGVRWPYLGWTDLGPPNLPRLVRLLSATLTSLAKDQSGRSMQYRDAFHDLEKVPLADASFDELAEVLNALLPQAGQLIGRTEQEEQPVPVEDRGWGADLRNFVRNVIGGLLDQDALATIKLVGQSADRLGELLLLDVLPRVAGTEAADEALEWLMAEPHRLRLRWSGSERPWQTSRSAVEQLTQLCSPGVCAKFERFLLDYREPRFHDEMRRRHDALLSPPEGRPRFSAHVLAWPSPHGETACHLLSCIPSDRRSVAARRRLVGLTRKFSSMDELYFAGWSMGEGGTVSSPLPKDRLNMLSDKTWLGIIRRSAVPSRRGGVTRYHAGRFLESSPENFAMDLQTATARQPSRFARLATRFPQDVDSVYIRAVLQGLHGNSQSDSPAEDVTLDDLETLLTLPQISAQSSVATAVTRLIERGAELNWKPQVLELVSQIATTHPDPEDQKLNVWMGGEEDWGPSNLTMNALNCARGAATYAMARLLFADPERLQVFAAAMDRIVADRHPAVRTAVFKCCLAALRTEPARAISWALRAAEGHEALLATPDFDRFLLYAARQHPEKLEPVLRAMLESPQPDVVRVAAWHIVAIHLVQGRWEELARDCVTGSTPKRVGAATVAAALAGSAEYGEAARSLLLELFDDAEDEVLAKCSEAFHENSLDKFSDAIDFVEAYAASRAFRRHPLPLLYQLKEYPDSLTPFASCILPVCRSLAGSRDTDDVSRWPEAVTEGSYYLPSVLLRLYGQSPNSSEVRERCLDAWDLLLDARVVSAVELTNELAIDA